MWDWRMQPVEGDQVITVDGFLVQGVHKVAGILDGVLDVTDGVHAATFTPQTLLGRLGLVLIFTESGLLWTGSTHRQKSLRHNERKHSQTGRPKIWCSTETFSCVKLKLSQVAPSQLCETEICVTKCCTALKLYLSVLQWRCLTAPSKATKKPQFILCCFSKLRSLMLFEGPCATVVIHDFKWSACFCFTRRRAAQLIREVAWVARAERGDKKGPTWNTTHAARSPAGFW